MQGVAGIEKTLKWKLFFFIGRVGTGLQVRAFCYNVEKEWDPQQDIPHPGYRAPGEGLGF